MRPLTERQQVCVMYTWHGLSNAAIGRRLYLSEHTVSNLLWDAHRRLGLAGAVGQHGARVRAACWLFRACRHAMLGGVPSRS